MESFEFIPPTDLEIYEAQRKLNFTFPGEYIDFIKSGYDLGDTALEALEITNPDSHVDIYTAISDAKSIMNYLMIYCQFVRITRIFIVLTYQVK